MFTPIDCLLERVKLSLAPRGQLHYQLNTGMNVHTEFVYTQFESSRFLYNLNNFLNCASSRRRRLINICNCVYTLPTSIRGSLGSLMMMSANFGILLAFVAGDYLPFAWVPRLFVCVPIVFVLTVLWFPETPFYFMRTNRELKAIASLEFYRNIRTHDDRGLVDFDGEMEKLKTVDLNGDTEIRVPLCVHDFSEFSSWNLWVVFN